MPSVFIVVLLLITAAWVTSAEEIPARRISPSMRKFNSTAVNDVIRNYTARMKDKNLATLFENCFPNTLDTTVLAWSREDTFVVTGDIHAMWLRDSTNQVLPYMRYVERDEKLSQLIRGLVLRQFRSVLICPYANAYNRNASLPLGHQTDLRRPAMQWALFEGKYELDSLCAVIKLAWQYYNRTSDASILTTESSLFLNAAEIIIETMENQTQSSVEQMKSHHDYEFFRNNWPWEYDTYPRVNPIGKTGMVRSAFRPSDDQTIYDFLVPSNFMAEVELEHLEQLLDQINATHLRTRVATLRAQIVEGLAGATSQDGVFAYEIDGLGAVNRMDDANVPSLLSLPYLGVKVDRNVTMTRSWVLSTANPYFYCGHAGCGVGSPHTWPGFIWPMAVTMRALTSNNDTEITEQLNILKTSAFDGFMHESFDPNNVKNFTRSWFAWANTLFGDLIVDLAERKPHLIF